MTAIPDPKRAVVDGVRDVLGAPEVPLALAPCVPVENVV